MLGKKGNSNNTQRLMWKAEFRIEPTLSKSERIEDYFFQVKSSGETIIEKVYETSSYNELHLERKEDNEYLEETLARLDAEVIRELMLKRMIYQRVFSPITVKLQKNLILINKDELKKGGVKLTRRIGFSFSLKNALLDVGDSLAESEHYWNSGFKNTTVSHERDVIRIADWLERSENERDPITSFILAWIGFNGLYGLMASLHGKGDQPDANKFEFAIKTLISGIQAENIIRNISNEIKHLETYNIMSDKGNTNWSANLSREMKKARVNKCSVLVLVARCVYGVRKQIFHEAPETGDVIERAEVSKAALGPITSTSLKAFINH